MKTVDGVAVKTKHDPVVLLPGDTISYSFKMTLDDAGRDLLFNGIPVYESPAVPPGKVIFASDPVRKIATYVPISKEAMDDMAWTDGIDRWAFSVDSAKVAPLPTRRDTIKKEIAKQRKLLKLLDRFGDEDPFKDEAVLAVDIRFPGNSTVYHYAVVRARGLFNVTGSRDPGPFTWEEFVLDFLSRGEEVHVFFANSMTEIG